MKKAVVFAILVAVFGLGQALAAENLKIGMVNFQQALNDVEQGKRAKAALKSEFDAKQKKLNLQQEELKQMQADLEKQKTVLSQEAMASKAKTFNDKFMELQKSMASYRDELMVKESKMTGQILKNLKSIIADIGQKEGFTLIVETSQDAVLYANATTDLTGRVVTMYNQKFTGSLKTE